MVDCSVLDISELLGMTGAATTMQKDGTCCEKHFQVNSSDIHLTHYPHGPTDKISLWGTTGGVAIWALLASFGAGG